ncbi:MAG TPA: sigma-70 family RNA polymerase sigma factor [Puia sp.]|jgi:RNA polymerase sigma-70 factor (ECF subfamily)
MLNNNPSRKSAETIRQFELFKEGDGRAFKYFYDLYHRPLYVFILNLLHSDIVAEEITNDVFILLGNERDKLNDVNHLVNFLYLVARRQALSQLFNLKKQVKIEAAWAKYQYEWATQLDEVEIIKDQVLMLIFEHVDKLPPKQKEVFLLNFCERMDVRSIAERLGTNRNNVYKHLTKAYQYFTTVFPRNHLVLVLLITIWK